MIEIITVDIEGVTTTTAIIKDLSSKIYSVNLTIPTDPNTKVLISTPTLMTLQQLQDLEGEIKVNSDSLNIFETILEAGVVEDVKEVHYQPSEVILRKNLPALSITDKIVSSVLNTLTNSGDFTSPVLIETIRTTFTPHTEKNKLIVNDTANGKIYEVATIVNIQQTVLLPIVEEIQLI